MAAIVGVVLTLPIWKENLHIWQAGALAATEALYAMEWNYQKAHGRYATKWDDLGCLLGASCGPKGMFYERYHFTLTGSPDGTSFRIVARPQEWGWLSWRSYLLDESRQIRSTMRDREPTDRDDVYSTYR